jgi:hypothetical protein
MTTTIRLFILNFAGACFVAWAWWLGYVQQVFNGDVSHLSYLIAAVFLASTAVAIAGRKSHLPRVEIILVTLGLIGNVIGFVIALSGMDVSAVGTADGAQKVAVELLAGMGVAFYSTLTGAVLALWTSVISWVAGGEHEQV